VQTGAGVTVTKRAAAAGTGSPVVRSKAPESTPRRTRAGRPGSSHLTPPAPDAACVRANTRPDSVQRMTYRVVVWGTGNVGRPALRAVTAHRDLELAGVVVSNPEKVGLDAGELAAIEPLGVRATDDPSIAFADDVDAVVYAATGDTRPEEALADLIACLRAGVDVVSTAFYPLLHPASAPREVLDPVEAACAEGDASVFVSGIDPGWALDILPALVSGVSAGIEEIRIQELFNYALYDQPAVVREVIGFGGPMEELPLMLLDFSLDMVWAPMVRVLADLLEVQLDAVTTFVERRPLERRSRYRVWGRSRPGRRVRSGSR